MALVPAETPQAAIVTKPDDTHVAVLYGARVLRNVFGNTLPELAQRIEACLISEFHILNDEAKAFAAKVIEDHGAAAQAVKSELEEVRSTVEGLKSNLSSAKQALDEKAQALTAAEKDLAAEVDAHDATKAKLAEATKTAPVAPTPPYQSAPANAVPTVTPSVPVIPAASAGTVSNG